MTDGFRRYLGSVRRVTASSAPAYGYTATVWSTGALVIDRHGVPHVEHVFLFVGGIVLAFTCLALITLGASDPPERAAERAWLLTGILHVLAIGVAVGAAALLARLGVWAAWPAAGFAGTAVYLALAGLERRAAERMADRHPGVRD